MSLEIFALVTVSILITLVIRITQLKNKIFDLEFENKQAKKRIYDLENGFSNLSNIILKDQSIYWTQTPEQKEAQRRSFVYGTTKLSNPNITEELVNEITESQKSKVRIIL